MGKKNSSTLIMTTLGCLLPIILSITLYDQLPEQIAVHWNSAGNPDNYMPKAIAVFGLPVLMAVLNFVVHIVVNNDPKKMNAAPAVRWIGLWIIPILSVIIMPVTLFKAMGADLPIETIAPAIVGILIIVTGNYFPKTKQNYTIGIKLPWTLHSEDNWNRTHRFAGYLWMIGGTLIIMTTFLKLNIALAILPIVVVLVVVPTVYSYSLYKKAE